jgi:hypothetical protein
LLGSAPPVSALSTMERSLGAKPPAKPNLSVVGDK